LKRPVAGGESCYRKQNVKTWDLDMSEVLVRAEFGHCSR
jgi:hypothetical protein